MEIFQLLAEATESVETTSTFYTFDLSTLIAGLAVLISIVAIIQSHRANKKSNATALQISDAETKKNSYNISFSKDDSILVEERYCNIAGNPRRISMRVPILNDGNQSCEITISAFVNGKHFANIDSTITGNARKPIYIQFDIQYHGKINFVQLSLATPDDKRIESPIYRNIKSKK